MVPIHAFTKTDTVALLSRLWAGDITGGHGLQRDLRLEQGWFDIDAFHAGTPDRIHSLNHKVCVRVLRNFTMKNDVASRLRSGPERSRAVSTAFYRENVVRHLLGPSKYVP